MKIKITLLLLLLIAWSGCSSSGSSYNAFDEVRVVEPTAKFHLAIGGVAPGRDELVIYDDSNQPRKFDEDDLECTASRDIVDLEPRPDYKTVSEGSGVRIVPKDTGIVAITCTSQGMPVANSYEVIIPSQYVIQILLAEAGEQIADEASVDADNVVALNSNSPTATALTYVIQNRVDMGQAYDDPGIFGADEDDFFRDPPDSYYRAIVEAPDQFTPLVDGNPAREIYDDASDRNYLKEEAWRIAYDQAVLTAAQVFAKDVEDPTGGAFGFRSPDAEEWAALNQALLAGDTELPVAGGVTDSSFPLLAPLQVLVHPDVWKYEDGRPSFIFVRKRGVYEPAVTDEP